MKITCGVAIFNNKNQLLIGKATNGNNWSIPKGLNENNETFEMSAIREVYEETGIDISKSKLELVGEENYKNQSKKIIMFKTYLDYLDLNKVVCNSFFEYKGKKLPELDKFELVTLNELHKYNIHNTQIILLNKIC